AVETFQPDAETTLVASTNRGAVNLRRTVTAGLMLTSTAVLSGGVAQAASAAAPLTLGFESDRVLVGGTPTTRALWISRAKTDGAGVVRINAKWSSIAPAKPKSPTQSNSAGYNW